LAKNIAAGIGDQLGAGDIPSSDNGGHQGGPGHRRMSGHLL
jgi:hypothetical protein